jgi:hypothetical protein
VQTGCKPVRSARCRESCGSLGAPTLLRKVLPRQTSVVRPAAVRTAPPTITASCGRARSRYFRFVPLRDDANRPHTAMLLHSICSKREWIRPVGGDMPRPRGGWIVWGTAVAAGLPALAAAFGPASGIEQPVSVTAAATEPPLRPMTSSTSSTTHRPFGGSCGSPCLRGSEPRRRREGGLRVHASRAPAGRRTHRRRRRHRRSDGPLVR